MASNFSFDSGHKNANMRANAVFTEATLDSFLISSRKAIDDDRTKKAISSRIDVLASNITFNRNGSNTIAFLKDILFLFLPDDAAA